MLKSFCATIALVLAAGGTAAAMPLAPPASTQGHIILVAGGCGPGFHRGRLGACRPNRGGEVVVEPGPVVVAPRVIAPVRLPPPCPRGYYRDPDPARPICYPRF